MNKTLIEAVNLINKDYKHVLEFGVYNGGTISQLRRSLPLEFMLYGFDSFIGLPEDWIGTIEKKGGMSVNGKIPKIDNVTFFKGWFKDTIPQYLEIAKPISLLHIDCDLYSSTKEVLNGLKDFIVNGSIIVFDEWYYNHVDIEKNRQHEQKAFLEFAEEYSIKYLALKEIENERKIIKIL